MGFEHYVFFSKDWWVFFGIFFSLDHNSSWNSFYIWQISGQKKKKIKVSDYFSPDLCFEDDVTQNSTPSKRDGEEEEDNEDDTATHMETN